MSRIWLHLDPHPHPHLDPLAPFAASAAKGTIDWLCIILMGTLVQAIPIGQSDALVCCCCSLSEPLPLSRLRFLVEPNSFQTEIEIGRQTERVLELVSNCLIGDNDPPPRGRLLDQRAEPRRLRNACELHSGQMNGAANQWREPIKWLERKAFWPNSKRPMHLKLSSISRWNKH